LDRIPQGQFNLFSAHGKQNHGDHFTKHNPLAHYQLMWTHNLHTAGQVSHIVKVLGNLLFMVLILPLLSMNV